MTIHPVCNNHVCAIFFTDGACGADAKVRAWMDSVANSAVDDGFEVKEEEETLLTTGATFANQTDGKRAKRSTYRFNYRHPYAEQYNSR